MQRFNGVFVQCFKTTNLNPLLLLAILILGVSTASAQYFPSFGSFTFNSSLGNAASVAIAQAPSATPGVNEVVAVYSSASNVTGSSILSAYSTDGVTYTAGIALPTFGMLGSPTLAMFNGNLYCALANTSGQLVVLEGSLSPGSNAYQWTEVYIQNSIDGGIVASPQMVQFGAYMHIIYPVSNINGIHNALVDTYTADGSNFTVSSAGLGNLTYAAPVQVGLSALNGVLYMTTQQNNSSRNLFYWSSTDGFTWSGNEDTSLQTNSGLSMVTYNSNLIMATKQNNNSNNVFLFSSPNGSTWFAQNQGFTMTPNTTPALALFNSGVSMAFIVSSGSQTFIEGAFASQ